MTTSLPRRGPSPFNPRATTSQPKSSNVSYASQHSRTKSRTENRRNTAETESNDISGNKNTVALIRRVLCPDVSAYGSSAPRPLQELLPPLTSSNDVDLQLYALIAVIIKEFVYSWYARITPDHDFVDEVLQLIAHCTRALEQRLRRVDVGQLVLDEVTGLVQAHITAYRIATQGSELVAGKPSAREIYHNLNPHPGLSPVPNVSTVSQLSEQQENENMYRHLLSQSVLAVLLPTEDLENVCLRTLVEDVLSDLILGNQVSGRICEGWFIWTAISKVITVVKQRDSAATVTSGQSLDATAEASRLERFGLLSEDRNEDKNAHKHSQSTVSLWLWKILSSAYLAYVTMHFIIGGLLHTALSNSEAATEVLQTDPVTTTMATNQPGLFRSVLSYRAFGLMSQLIGLPQRMPWLNGSLSLIQSLLLTGPGKLGETGSVLDRYLRNLISTYVLTPTILPVLLFTVRTTLFPSNARPGSVSTNNNIVIQEHSQLNNDISPSVHQQQQGQSSNGTGHQTVINMSEIKDASTPAPGDSTPSPSEIAAIKRQCATDILSLIPESIARAFFRGSADYTTNVMNEGRLDEIPPSTSKSSSRDSTTVAHHAEEEKNGAEELLQAIESDLLDPYSDAYCNKHLIYAIVELVLVKLIPELSEQSVSSLMEERGIVS